MAVAFFFAEHEEMLHRLRGGRRLSRASAATCQTENDRNESNARHSKPPRHGQLTQLFFRAGPENRMSAGWKPALQNGDGASHGEAGTEGGGLGGSEEEDGAGGGLEGRGVPAGLHEARGGVGVGAKEKVAEFVSEDAAEEIGVGELRMVRGEHEILVVDIGVNALAVWIDEGLSEDV